jgi:hypothetical protein
MFTFNQLFQGHYFLRNLRVSFDASIVPVVFPTFEAQMNIDFYGKNKSGKAEWIFRTKLFGGYFT